MKRSIINLSFLILTAMLVTSCKNDPSFQREVQTFFASVFFFFVMFISGIPAIVFSAINVKSEKASINTLAIVFLSIFGLFSLLSLKMFVDVWSYKTSGWLGLLCFIQYGSLATCVIMFIVKGSAKKTISPQQPVQNAVERIIVKPSVKQEVDDLDYLDKFLDDDLEEG